MYIYTWFHTYRYINIRFHVEHVTWYQSDVTLYVPSPDPFQTFTYLLYPVVSVFHLKSGE